METELLTLNSEDIPLLLMYRDLRFRLNGEREAIEVKNTGIGIVSWTTRGQLGIQSYIKATTGFQNQGYDHSELVTVFKDCLKGKDKYFEFVQQRLRGAKDIYLKGGHVTRNIRDQIFRLFYDNRRQIEHNKLEDFDMSNKLLDSIPLISSDECLRMRFLSKLPFTLPYNKNTSRRKVSKYRSFLDVAVRNFLKGYLAKEPLFGLKGSEFDRYQDIMSFIYGFELAKDIRLSKQSISNLKHRRIIFKTVPQTKETIAFAQYIKEKIPGFSSIDFFKNG